MNESLDFVFVSNYQLITFNFEVSGEFRVKKNPHHYQLTHEKKFSTKKSNQITTDV